MFPRIDVSLQSCFVPLKRVPYLSVQVAAKIVKGVKRGDFCITIGTDGYLLALGTQGFSPCFSVVEAILQVRSGTVHGAGYGNEVSFAAVHDSVHFQI